MMCVQCAKFFEVIIESRLDNEPTRIWKCLVNPTLFDEDIPDLGEDFFDGDRPRIFKCTQFEVKSTTH